MASANDPSHHMAQFVAQRTSHQIQQPEWFGVEGQILPFGVGVNRCRERGPRLVIAS